MATVKATIADASGDGTAITAKWVLAATDDGAPLEMVSWGDRSIQVGTTGDTFNAGTVILEGSNDALVWTTLRDPAGVALSFTANGLKQVLELVRYIRPRASVSVTQVTVVVAARRASSIRT